MRYSNPPIPAVPALANEYRELFTLLAKVGTILLVLMVGSAMLASTLAPYIPFSVEMRFAASVAQRIGGTPKPQYTGRQAALQTLTDRLVGVMELPSEMSITVHYVDEPVVNAAATVGGHLFVYRGLIEKLQSEQALAAVLAHEIGHVRQRHVIQTLGRGIAILVALRAVGVKSQYAADWLMGETAELTALSFSRDAEREADAAALDAVERLYGNVGGVMELFEFFAEYGGGRGGIELWRTHPLAENRQTELEETARRLGYSLAGERLPMPAGLTASGKMP